MPQRWLFIPIVEPHRPRSLDLRKFSTLANCKHPGVAPRQRGQRSATPEGLFRLCCTSVNQPRTSCLEMKCPQPESDLPGSPPYPLPGKAIMPSGCAPSNALSLASVQVELQKQPLLPLHSRPFSHGNVSQALRFGLVFM